MDDDDIPRMQMHIQSTVLDIIDLMEDQEVSVGYVDHSDGSMYINAFLIHEMLIKLREQALSSDDARFRMAVLMSMLAIAESLKLANMHLVGYDADSIAEWLDT